MRIPFTGKCRYRNRPEGPLLLMWMIIRAEKCIWTLAAEGLREALNSASWGRAQKHIYTTNIYCFPSLSIVFESTSSCSRQGALIQSLRATDELSVLPGRKQIRLVCGPRGLDWAPPAWRLPTAFIMFYLTGLCWKYGHRRQVYYLLIITHHKVLL